MNDHLFFANTIMVAIMQKAPNHSNNPKETCNQITAKSAADSGSAHASKLVSLADKYFKLSK